MKRQNLFTKSFALAGLVAVSAWLTLSGPVATTAQSAQNSNNKNAEQAIRQLMSELSNAQQKGDTATLDRIWADDFTFTNSSGEVQTKAQRMAEIKSGELKFESLSRDDVQVRVYGDAAVVTSRGTVKGQRRGQDISGQSRGTSVYVKKQGRWQVVATHVTRIAQQ
jgi:uncharacterized protein (TIGR02246 family)